MYLERLEIKGFGKLKDRSIELKKGLNVLYGGNEAGKSTLLAFINGMLYGLKSGRQAAGLLPPLKRYEPWDGGSYGGALLYGLDNGKTYRVERNFKTGSIRIFDSLYSDITGDFEIGRDKSPAFAERQLGMDEATFTRTVLIRQMELRLGEDDSETLAGRLSNINSAGIEDVSFSKAKKAISDALKNGVGTGRTRTQPLDRLEARRAQLEETSERLRHQQERTFAARKDLRDARERCSKLETEGKYLEEIRKLVELRRALDGYLKKEAVLKETARQLKELDAAAALNSGGPMHSGGEALPRRSRERAGSKGLLMALACLCALVACFTILLASGVVKADVLPLPTYLFGLLTIASALTCAFLIYKYFDSSHLSGSRAFSGAADTENTKITAGEMKREMLLKDASFSCGTQFTSPTAVDQELRGISLRLEELSGKLDSGIEAAVASEYASHGYFNRDALDTVIYDSDIADLDEALETENNEIKRQLFETSLKIKYYEGLLGDDREISDELQHVTEETIVVEEKIAYLKNKGESLRLALEVLNEASTEIRRNFAPDVNQYMSRIFSGLTGGKYSDMRGNERLSLRVALPDGADVRSVLSLSGGTADQAYLALRLAMAEMLTAGGETLPLIFDEVFSQFDDRRTSLALQYLHNIYFDKQILVFTCKQREVELAGEIYGDCMNLVRLEYDQTAF